ncbi:MAG: MFS transporter [Lapillicoccus sp.]
MRQFRIYLAALGLDTAGDGLWLVTLAWVAAGASSAFWTGLIMFAGTVPAIGSSLLGGNAADLYSARRVVVWTMAVRLVLMAFWTATATRSDVAPIIAVTVTALLYDATLGIHDSAVAAYTTDLLPAEAQESAVVTERLVTRLAQGLAALAGGYLLHGFGLGGPCLLAIAVLLIAWRLFLTLKQTYRRGVSDLPAGGSELPPKVPALVVHKRGDLLLGIRVVAHEPILSRTMMVQAVTSAAAGAVIVTGIPLKARSEHWSAETFGIIFGAFSLGLMVGTLLSAYLKTRVQRPVLLGVGLVLIVSLGEMLVGIATSPIAAGVWAGMMGIASGPVGPFLTGYARRRSIALSAEHDGRVSGRVMSVLTLGLKLEPAGYLLLGACASVWNVSVAMILTGLVAAVVTGWALASPAVRSLRE